MNEIKTSQVKNSHYKYNLANFRPQLGAFLRHYHINTKSYGQICKIMTVFHLSYYLCHIWCFIYRIKTSHVSI
jgi:hypothetical protein